jgi:hypothetical protein
MRSAITFQGMYGLREYYFKTEVSNKTLWITFRKEIFKQSIYHLNCVPRSKWNVMTLWTVGSAFCVPHPPLWTMRSQLYPQLHKILSDRNVSITFSHINVLLNIQLRMLIHFTIHSSSNEIHSHLKRHIKIFFRFPCMKNLWGFYNFQ